MCDMCMIHVINNTAVQWKDTVLAEMGVIEYTIGEMIQRESEFDEIQRNTKREKRKREREGKRERETHTHTQRESDVERETQRERLLPALLRL